MKDKILINIPEIADLFLGCYFQDYAEESFRNETMSDDYQLESFFSTIKANYDKFDSIKQARLKNSLIYAVNFLKENELTRISLDAHLSIPFGMKTKKFYTKLWLYLFDEDFLLDKSDKRKFTYSI